MTRIPLALPEGLEFKVADTADEFEQVFALLHEEYTAHHYCDPNEAQLRITNFHSLPTTAILIGKIQDEVVCTLSVIRDTSFGLPSDGAWDLSQLRTSGASIAEISSLAIKRGAQGRRGLILLPLCKFMFEFCTHYAEIDIIFISTLEAVRYFYADILLFRSIGEAIKTTSFVKNVVAFGQYLDFRTAVEQYRSVYSGKDPKKDFYHFFVEAKFSQFHFPEKKLGQCAFPSMPPETLDYFFNKKLEIISRMTPQQKQILFDTYFFSSYRDIIGFSPVQRAERKEPRVPTRRPATLLEVETAQIRQVSLVEVSMSGFIAKTGSLLTPGGKAVLNVDLGELGVCRIEARAVWKNEYGNVGFQIQSVDGPQWKYFVDQLVGQLPAVENREITSQTEKKRKS